MEKTTTQPGSGHVTTMSAVAAQARVSVATVSRVLNGDPRVGAVYKRRVLAAVDNLSYRPNRLARNLRKRRSASIGVVVSDIENPHFSEAIRAIEDDAYGRGFTVLVCNTDESAAKQRTYLEMMLDERVLGVVLSPSDPADPTIGTLIDAGIPLVAFDREVTDSRADAVVVDNVRATWIATERLLKAGRTNIVFLGGRIEVETGAERLDGYEHGMRAAGLAPRSVDGGFRADGARVAVERLLASGEATDALIVANNLMTLGALRALRDAQIRVPEQIALIAIDDPPWAALVEPPLTALAQPVRRMATDAMDLLLDRVNGRRTEPRRIVHELTLTVRASCGTGPT